MQKHNSMQSGRFLTPKQVKQFRRAQGWTATQLGTELGNGLPGYSRSYVKSIEGGSLPISEKFAAKFTALRARVMGERVLSKEIVSRHYLPRRLVIAPKPKRCPVCKWSFVGVTPRQKYCGEACARQARQARGKGA